MTPLSPPAVQNKYGNKTFEHVRFRDTDGAPFGNVFFQAACKKALGRKESQLTLSDLAFATVAVRSPLPTCVCAPRGRASCVVVVVLSVSARCMALTL